MNIVSLRKKAKDGSLEVDDVLRAAIERQPGLSEELSRLAVEHGWQRDGIISDGSRVVPLARWAEVASTYTTEGFSGLATLVRDPTNVPFVLSLVEEIKISESVTFILELCSNNIVSQGQSADLALRIASAVNMLLSFKKAAPVDSIQARKIQAFLIALYPRASTEANRATVLLALRGVGNHEAIQFVESVPDFNEPWRDVKKSVLKAVRKRVKQHSL